MDKLAKINLPALISGGALGAAAGGNLGAALGSEYPESDITSGAIGGALGTHAVSSAISKRLMGMRKVLGAAAILGALGLGTVGVMHALGERREKEEPTPEDPMMSLLREIARNTSAMNKGNQKPEFLVNSRIPAGAPKIMFTETR